jgi:hypothetical protein
LLAGELVDKKSSRKIMALFRTDVAAYATAAMR